MSINMTQHFEFETDDIDSLKSMLLVILPILFNNPTMPSSIYAELFITDQPPVLYGFGDEQRFFICSVRDYKSGMKEGDLSFGKDSSSKNFEKIADEVLSRLNRIDFDKFKEKRGNGYHAGFDITDGSIDLGHRLEVAPNGGWDSLDVYLVHAYYGK